MFTSCFSETNTEAPSTSQSAHSTSLRNTRERKPAPTTVSKCKRTRGRRSPAAAAWSSWLLEEPQSDTTNRSSWLFPFTNQPGHVGGENTGAAKRHEFPELFLN